MRALLLLLFLFVPAANLVIREDFSYGMRDWWVEGGEKVWVEGGRLHVRADNPGMPGGGVATVWLRKPHPASFRLEVDAHVVESSIDANNINLFFCYSDPSGAPLEQTRASRATAGYDLYHHLSGYIVTFLNDSQSSPRGKAGDAASARVRLRRDPGFRLLAETFAYQCRRGITYHLTVEKQRGSIRFSVDGRELLRAMDPEPLGGGLLGLRTYRTWLWWDNLRITALN